MNAVPLRVRAAAELELRRRATTSDNKSDRDIIARNINDAPSLHRIADGGAIVLNMHDGQWRAWQSVKRIVAIIAGSQSGKTVFGPWWMQREVRKRGAGDYIAATSSYDLFKLKMLPEMRNVFEHVLRIGRYWSGDKIMEIADPTTGKFLANRADDPMWARIILRSAVAAGGLESTTAKAAWLDEAGQDDFTVEAWEAVQRRLTLNEGPVLITTTPYNLGWLKQQIVDKESSDPDIDVIQFPSIQNPAFPRAEFERQREKLPAWKFSMFFEGLYTRPPGMIYSDFIDEYRERGGHKVKPFDIPSAWPRIVGVDPGVLNTCKVWAAQDIENGDLYIYRESLGDRKSASEHAREALSLALANGERVVRWAVGAKSEIYHREDWIKAGAVGVVEPEYADVEAGIDRVIQLLRGFRIFFFETCTGLLSQMGTYSRELDANSEPTKVIKNKAAYHYLDALRYLAAGTPERKPIAVSVKHVI